MINKKHIAKRLELYSLKYDEVIVDYISQNLDSHFTDSQLLVLYGQGYQNRYVSLTQLKETDR